MNQAVLTNRSSLQANDTELVRVSGLAFFGLVGYLVLAIMRFQEYTWINLNAPIIPVIEMIMIVGWLFSPKPPGFSNYLPVILLGAVYFISSIAAVGADYSVEVTSNYYLNIAFVYIVLAQVASDPRRADAVMVVFCTCMAIISVQCILMNAHPDHMGWTGLQAWQRMDSIDRFWQVRYIGTLGDPNDLGMTLLAAVPMLGYLCTNQRSRLLQAYFLLCLGLCLYTIFLLNSRGTILGLIAMVGVWALLRFGVGKSIVFLIVGIPIAITFAPSRLAESSLDRSALDRVDSWYNGMKMFASHPFFGVGKDQYLAHHYKVSHNSWIEIVAELGMIGYLLWNRIVLGALIDAFQMVLGDSRLVRRAELDAQERNKALAREKKSPVASGKSKVDLNPGTAEATLAGLDSTGAARIKALFFSIVGILVAIFFIDRSDSLITFLVCALIAGSLTCYQHTRRDIDWLPVAFWVYAGAFIALVVVYVSVQVFVLT